MGRGAWPGAVLKRVLKGGTQTTEHSLTPLRSAAVLTKTVGAMPQLRLLPLSLAGLVVDAEVHGKEGARGNPPTSTCPPRPFFPIIPLDVSS